MEIKLQNIRKRFGETVALDDLSLEFCDGKLTTLLGPSGCGKSTLLNLISGILPPTSGSIYFGDRDVTSLSPDKRNIGLVFQNYALYPHMTVGENIAFPLEIKKVSKKERMERAAEFAKLLRIEDYFTRKPSQLSGGQQQRVAIARALAKEPEILLLDEPLSNLDARLRLEMREEIRRLQLETGITTIFVTHDQDEAMVMSDEIHLFHDGRIEQSGTPTEMYTAPRTRFAAGFIGSYNIFTAAEFKKLCGEDTDAPDVAIRPEVVRLNYETSAPAPRYYAKGTIVNSLSHGNLVRYTVRCHDIDINSDVMFEKHSLLEVGEEVEVSIRKTNVIMLY